MVYWRRRLGGYLLIVGIFLPVFLKCRPVPDPKRAGFLRYTAGYLLVKVINTSGFETINRFSDGTTLLDVKKMTLGDSGLDSSIQSTWLRRLKNGDIVNFKKEANSAPGITVKSMTAAECIVLDIPLDPDTMSLDDWMSLPGIGRSLAETIIMDRQKNGEFKLFENVLRVPGIGAGRIKSLKKYF